MQQTIINGYRVMIFKGYDGTQLFINNPAGDNIYAHRVSGDAIERAKDIIALDAPAAPETADKMICLSERRGEFAEALIRGKNSNLEVFADWDKDVFVVVNTDNKNEYRVHLESRDGQLHAMCQCKDFEFRKRTCKHISQVLVFTLFQHGNFSINGGRINFRPVSNFGGLKIWE